MNATIKTLTLLATLAASLFVSQSARASSCDLPVVGETHLLRALSNDSYVQSINLQGWTGPLGPESEIEIVPGLGDPNMVSLRSVDHPDRYYALVWTSQSGFMVDLVQDDGSADFKGKATFEIVAGLSTGICNYTGVSFRLVASGTTNPMYLSRDKQSGRLHIQFKGSNQTTTAADQTFAIDWEEEDGTCH